MGNIKIAHIVAYDQESGIGIGDLLLPWKISEDLKRFKSLTMGHPVIMGRKTYDSIGRPLKGRDMIVISRQSLTIDGCKVANTFDDAIAFALDYADRNNLERIFIIGGGEIYKATGDLVDEVFATEVDGTHGADRFYQLPSGLTLIEQSSIRHEDNKNFVFKRYLRKTL